MCEKFGIAIDWTKDNVLPYLKLLCEKLITYEIVTSVLWLIFGVGIIIGSIIAVKKFYPVVKEQIEEQGPYDICWDIVSTFMIIGLVLLNIAAVIIIITKIGDIVQCVIFPELYILEYIKQFIANSSAQ